MLRHIKELFQDDEGAVTVDWVVLAAAVVGLAGITYNAINGPTGTVASSVSSELTSTPVSK